MTAQDVFEIIRIFIVFECLVLCVAVLMRMRDYPTNGAKMMLTFSVSWYIAIYQLVSILDSTPPSFIRLGYASSIGMALILFTLILSYTGRRNSDAN